MMPLSFRAPQLVAAGAAAVGVCAILGFALRRKHPRPEDLERLRRLQLVKTGRLVDGTVLDVRRVDPLESGEPQETRFLSFQYEIAGVVYECSQDVTLLRGFVDIDEVRVGYPCTVRYQPRNPVNSIVVAETWSGLRDEMPPLQQSAH